MLAILALGGAAVPISPALPVEEAAFFINRSRAALVLVSTLDLEKCCKLEERIARSNEHFRAVPIGPCTLTPALSPTDIHISSDRALEENGPSVVIFTSGTTGPPKGAVMRRSFVFDCALSVADHYQLAEDDVMLHVLPVHHATGVGINFFPFLISGSRIEFRSGGFDEAWMWLRWKEGAVNPRRRLTFFSGVPTIYMRMRRHYQHKLAKLPSDELSKYIAGARQFRACLCGTSALPQPLNDFWTTLMQRRIVQRYGATEFGAVFKVHLNDTETPDGSVGELVHGIDLKLSDGDKGEILVKSPVCDVRAPQSQSAEIFQHMFSKYLYDPEATAAAHDSDGYFRTGDIARKEGKYYFIVGRASLDIIKSGGYKISAGNHEHILTIEDLRRDLRNRLAGYKLPTLLRVADGELPKTVTGKVQKKILGPRFFPFNYGAYAEVQQWIQTREVAKL
ncbi:acetyl-CoA synthetase-like protein [Polyplosphaeria fusca]|uniref:Acetyl-CoA synthetase-like protein n=1 Tax=Polyplosphaeria fusca TaxID=682080 RepID=A0A9P4R424_9PLEO|nr:acetyl-CoA synthetase-like protein [Polyplosphaeria fusca]